MLETVDRLVQPVLPVLVATTLFLIAKRNRWGFVVGLATQPVWILTYWLHRQWGGLLTVAISTSAFVVGVREWRRPHYARCADAASETNRGDRS